MHKARKIKEKSNVRIPPSPPKVKRRPTGAFFMLGGMRTLDDLISGFDERRSREERRRAAVAAPKG